MVNIATKNSVTGVFDLSGSDNAARNGGQSQIDRREMESPTNSHVGIDLSEECSIFRTWPRQPRP